MPRALLWMTLICASAAHATDIKSVRIGTEGERTQASIELSEVPDYRVFMLANPDRLVLDVKEGRLRRGLDVNPRGLITAVRSGQPEADRLRIVFDLKEGVRPKTYVESGKRFRHRLVIDMTPASTPQAPSRSANAAPAPTREVIIAIDAGHGGVDPGAVGANGTHEKAITLRVARLLAERIDAEPGMRSVLIRDSDSFVSLGNRFEKAREQKADSFVSIHADAAINRKARGSSVYMLSTRGATNEAARYLAERENRSDLVGGVSLNGRDSMLAAVLLDLSQGAALEASAHAAEHVLASLTRMGKAHKRHVERANFVVLRSPDVPSVLIETGFISNPEEESKLNDPKHRARLADAILLGLRDYFHSSPPPGTWIAANVKSRAHVVAFGETLTEIAVRHGVSVLQIRQANSLETDRVRVGEVLKIPTSS